MCLTIEQIDYEVQLDAKEKTILLMSEVQDVVIDAHELEEMAVKEVGKHVRGSFKYSDAVLETMNQLRDWFILENFSKGEVSVHSI